MLMGLCEVSKEGELSLKGDARVLYSVMMAIRMLIVIAMGAGSIVASKIAIRYCCVRRQFSSQEGTKDERKVIDYQTNMFTQSRILASGFTMYLAGQWTKKEFKKMRADVAQQKFSRLDPCHHIFSGFKALFS